jgi:hypothetical protein
MPSIKQALGLEKKKPKETAAQKARTGASKVGTGRIATVQELEQQIKLLEGVTRKLAKAHQAGNKDSQDAAFQVKTAAERILANMDPLIVMLGPKYKVNQRRLQNVMGESDIIWGEHLRDLSKKKAGEIYRKGGAESLGVAENPADQVQGPQTKHGMSFLTGAARITGMGAKSHKEDGTEAMLEGHGANIQAAGKKLGLSAGEIAAINTFSNEDYNYINPATANATGWMKAANKDKQHPLIEKEDRTPEEEAAMKQALADGGISMAQRAKQRDEEAAARRLEGAMHAGMAMQGLMKLPVWPRGKVYRGEVLNEKDFEAKFVKDKKGDYKIRNTTITRNTISSSSRSEAEARKFWVTAAGKVKAPRVNIIYEWDIFNGRDIEMLSNSPWEQEVATLPGTELKVTSTETSKFANGKLMYLFVRAKQVK